MITAKSLSVFNLVILSVPALPAGRLVPLWQKKLVLVLNNYQFRPYV